MAIVTNQTEFREAITAGEAEIILSNTITLTAYCSITYAVTIRGETSDTSLLWGNPTASNRNMLVLSASGELTLESIILDAENRDGTLVQINGGTLIMKEGAVLRNIQSTTAQRAVMIAPVSTSGGGTLIMNGGRITGIRSDTAVFSDGGTVVMNNNAAINGNEATGVTIAKISADGRATLTMTGHSCIYDNHPRTQGAGGVTVYQSDMYMGVDEGDAPEVYENRVPSGAFAGGVILTSDSTLTMGYDAKIRDNYSDFAAGGVLAQNAVMTMSGNASIVDNVCEGAYGGGGVRVHQDAKLIIEDNASVSNNSSVAYGGGVYLQPGGQLEMKGTSHVEGNEGVNGAGVYIGPPTASIPLPTSALIGDENSVPSIHLNNASGYGGGIYIGHDSILTLKGNVLISENTAGSGKGIYKEGILNVSQSPKVLDGLFFDGIEDLDGTAHRAEPSSDIRIAAEPSEDESRIVLKAIPYDIKQSSILQETHDSDNVPIITDQLTSSAEIQLETSAYVSPENVPLVIADKGTEYEVLTESDRAAWKIPTEFGSGYSVILNEEKSQVLIAHEVYEITYYNLFDADNDNPVSYSAESEFPIVLKAPGERIGYAFAGWYNSGGEPVAEIAEGTLGEIQVTALWNERAVLRR